MIMAVPRRALVPGWHLVHAGHCGHGGVGHSRHARIARRRPRAFREGKQQRDQEHGSGGTESGPTHSDEGSGAAQRVQAGGSEAGVRLLEAFRLELDRDVVDPEVLVNSFPDCREQMPTIANISHDDVR